MAKKASNQGKKQYAAYKTENRWLNNKIARLEKTVNAQPNNEVAKDALKRAKAGKVKYNRNTIGNSTPQHDKRGFILEGSRDNIRKARKRKYAFGHSVTIK